MVTSKGKCHKAPSLDHFFVPIYINGFSNNLLSTVKLFADNTSLFCVVSDSNISANMNNLSWFISGKRLSILL